MSWICPECQNQNDDMLIRCVCGFEEEVSGEELTGSRNQKNKLIEILFPGLSNERIILISRLSAVEVIDRLKAEVSDASSLKNLSQQKLIIGTVTDNSVSLIFNSSKKNSFRKTLSATIRDHESGSIINGQFNVNVFSKYLFVAFVTIMAAIFIPVMLISLYGIFFYGKLPSVDLAIRALIVLIILVSFISIGRNGTISSKNEVEYMKQFLISILDAEEN